MSQVQSPVEVTVLGENKLLRESKNVQIYFLCVFLVLK